MIKYRIQKIVNNKYFGVILVIFINIAFFITCNMLFEPKYEQVDDFIIMNLISKMDGNYNIYGVQMHPIICGIIILLYQTGININWYTIFMLCMQFISFTIIGTVFVNKNKTIGIPLYCAFVFMIYSKMLIYIQYTTVSMLCITSGFILLMYSIEDIYNMKKSRLILPILMVFIGCMIRFSTVIIAIPFIALYLVCKLIKEKKIKIFKIFVILILGIILINISFNIIYNLNPTYKNFLKFHDARTYLHDYNWMNYNNNTEEFNSANWSENDRDIFYAYCFGDEKTYNIGTLEKIKQTALNNTDNNNIFKRCINSFNVFSKEVENSTYKNIFLLVAILVICNNLTIIINKTKNEKSDTIKVAFISFTFIAIIAMHCLFIFLDRPIFRVVISIYTIGIAILMYLLLDGNKITLRQLIKYILIIVMFFISVQEFNTNIYYAKYYNHNNFKVYREILEYTNSHKENAYLYTLVMHDRYLAYSVYEKVDDNVFSNVRPLGDWDTYTKNYYNFKERYNIDNLIESLYKKDNVYLISGNVIWGEGYKDYIEIIEKYIEEHYNIKVESNVVKEFDNDIKIYKLEEK